MQSEEIADYETFFHTVLISESIKVKNEKLDILTDKADHHPHGIPTS